MKRCRLTVFPFLLFFLSLNLICQDFQSQASKWFTPSGGVTNLSQGFNLSSNISATNIGDNNWVYMDMNGDKKPDLVVTSIVTTTSTETFGLGNNKNWKVFLNKDTCFDLNPIYWQLPSGGTKNTIDNINGFCLTANEYPFPNQTIGSEFYNTLDINNDSKPDLIVTAVLDVNGIHTFTNAQSRYWKVFLNNGFGFDTIPLSWINPVGGIISYLGSSINNGFITTSHNDASGADYSHNYFLKDLDGDDKIDLVISSFKKSDAPYNLGNVVSIDSELGQYWSVFLNTGTGFQTQAIKFQVPWHNYFYNQGIASMGYESGNTYNLLDINGDKKPDLILTGKGLNGYLNNDNPLDYFPSWKVFLNNGNGFSTSGIFWKLPIGGIDRASGVIHNPWPQPDTPVESKKGFYDLKSGGDDSYNNPLENLGSEYWDVRDFDGDNKPDLCITSAKTANGNKTFGTDSIPNWRIFLNNGKSFNSDAINVVVPKTRGIKDKGLIFTEFVDLSFTPSGEQFIFSDINGDNKPDIVVTSEFTGGGFSSFGTSIYRYWKIFINNYRPTEKTYITEIYPNPFNEKLIISLEELTNEGDIIIFDLLGKEIYSQHIKSNETELDLSFLNTGLYFIKIQSADFKIVKKVIKTR
jgi:hypothetical protein